MRCKKEILLFLLVLLLFLGGNTVFAAGDQVTTLPDPFPSEDITYYGRWTAKASIISFEENGGSTVDDLIGVTDQVITNRTPPISEKEGYTLTGWYDNASLSGEKITLLPDKYPIDGITYYAEWTINSYTVNFESNGGSIVTSKITIHGNKITEPTKPTKENAFFDTWCTNSELTEVFDFNTPITKDRILYAKWTNIPPAGNALNTYSWEEIKLISEAGKGDEYFNVGDEKTLTINGVDYQVQIYGFNHDDLADGTGKAGITFGTKDLLLSTHQMNPSNTNQYGWDGSDMRAYLNGVPTAHQVTSYAETSIYAQLPSDLQSVIAPVTKKTSGGYGDTTLKTSHDRLFLFSEEEVGFDNYAYSITGEGSKYAIFGGQSDNASRVKTYPSGTAGWWWLRSASSYYNSTFLGVSSNGSLNDTTAGSSSGVAFGFCI